MQRFLICLLLTLSLALSVHAQVPTYKFTGYPGATTISQLQFNTKSAKVQAIYNPLNFPGMPAGRIKAIYIRSGANYENYYSKDTAWIPYMTVKMGISPDTNYVELGGGVSNFRTGLTTMYGPDSFAFPWKLATGDWIKIPLTKGNFQYTTETKFIVEIAKGPLAFADGFWIMGTNYPNLTNKTVVAHSDRNATQGPSPQVVMDLGIDLGQPADVAAFSHILSFGLFPNPSTDGRFNISFDAHPAISEARLSVTDVTGKIVLRQQYSSVGNSFFKEIDLGTATKGIYFVEVVADGERIVRRVLAQ